ncbi:MAG: hypothetical protein ACR650_03305 [Methylocystis sp.]|jgi:hypothetical protein
MSDEATVQLPLSQSSGHPHELLARLYREIGLSAVAAALQLSSSDAAEEDGQALWLPLGEDLAA